MPAFHFGLQKVLDHRKESERRSAHGLARARGEADEARRARDDLEAAREAGRARLAEAHGAGGAVGHLQNLAYVLSSVDGQIDEAHAACREADEQLVESMKDFQHAVRERKTIEGLREKKLVQWRDAETRGERKEMDEVARVRYARARRTSPGGEE